MIPLILFLSLSVFGYGHDVNYTMTSGSIQNMTIDHATNTLLIDINANGDGLLAIEVPRNLLDTNSTFIVLDEGYMIDSPKEIDTKCCRNLVIPYTHDDQRITITGTTSVPDMTTWATAFILMISLIGSIVLTKKWSSTR